MGCERFQNMMVDSLYGDLDEAPSRELGRHLEECSTCAAEFSAMRSTLEVMNRRERPDPGGEFWDGYWDRLSERMEREGVVAGDAVPWWKRRAGAPGRWAYRAAAAAAILLVGVFAGRTIFAPEAPVTVQPRIAAQRPAPEPSDKSGEPGEETVARREQSRTDAGEAIEPAPPANMEVRPASSERAMRYIEKSQLLLVALVNNDPSAPDGYAADFGTQQERSRRLVGEAAAIKDELDDPGQRRLRELVTELEKILLQIANLESSNDMDAVEFIRSRVDEHDVLLKINLEQLRHGTDVDGSASGESREQRSIW